MTSFVHVERPTQHPGVERMERFFAWAEQAYARWQASRRQARADEALWTLALQDARVMADISRAMARDAAGDVRRVYARDAAADRRGLY